MVDRERVVCRPSGPLSFLVETSIVAPDGKVIHQQKRDAAEQRRAEESAQRRLSETGYDGDPRSLVCWAAARKCENKPFSWPPPPNNTPLERSLRAARMMAEYNRMFVPACALPGK